MTEKITSLDKDLEKFAGNRNIIGDRPASILVILRRAYLNITGNHCAAKLIEYFRHWTKWKEKNHRTDWIYMPMRQIHEDLMGEHSLHVIRAAIALLVELGILDRQHNPSNGQDKTWQYRINQEVLLKLLKENDPNYEQDNLIVLPSLERSEDAALLKAMSYSSFLRSDYWKAVRKHVLKIRGNKCENCEKTYKLQVHHLSYEHHGQEHLYLDDLKLLCAHCHKTHHDLAGGVA